MATRKWDIRIADGKDKERIHCVECGAVCWLTKEEIEAWPKKWSIRCESCRVLRGKTGRKRKDYDPPIDADLLLPPDGVES